MMEHGDMMEQWHDGTNDMMEHGGWKWQGMVGEHAGAT